jgi:sRNA-binding carbon storage regulator CsrA
MKISKLILPALIVTALLIIHFAYFAPSQELGSFSNFSAGSEINQRINVIIVKTKKIGKDGNVLSFYVKDIDNNEVRVTLHEPESKEILNAEIVELLGHMHENDFTASRVSIIK